ncbi:MAG: glycosyltransferase family 2 protein [Oscillospiraceae bacterium]|nr:glycosyltransferase family 2 protein [Oscillospiraceae bacterium]
MPLITVFTPTYNRAGLLRRGFEALKRQTCKDFLWLIIDDGSTDNTREIVNQFREEESSFEIRYVYKENGGLHTGYNEAIAHLDTELAVCVDSDDYLVDSAIERVSAFWKEKGNDSLAGVIALDAEENGRIIGDLLPGAQLNLIALLLGKYHITNGDRKLFVRSVLYKAVAPQIGFPGEKNFNPHYMHLKISEKYDFLVLNEAMCIVEYQGTGMSNGIFRQYLNSPRSFAETRRLYLSYPNAGLAFRFRQCIHYVSSSIHAKDVHFLRTSPAKWLTFFAIPFGIMLSVYVRIKAKNR